VNLGDAGEQATIGARNSSTAPADTKRPGERPAILKAGKSGAYFGLQLGEPAEVARALEEVSDRAREERDRGRRDYAKPDLGGGAKNGRSGVTCNVKKCEKMPYLQQLIILSIGSLT
jgi:hypothetical protein